jgi:hypothetical protein
MVIFVYGSNQAGRHGRGAALTAKLHYGAVFGKTGFSGHSYGINTKDYDVETLPLDAINVYVSEFLDFARANPEMQFVVTKVGCGLAGYGSHQIAPMFKQAPDNCRFDQAWMKYLPGKKFFIKTER